MSLAGLLARSSEKTDFVEDFGIGHRDCVLTGKMDQDGFEFSTVRGCLSRRAHQKAPIKWCMIQTGACKNILRRSKTRRMDVSAMSIFLKGFKTGTWLPASAHQL